MTTASKSVMVVVSVLMGFVLLNVIEQQWTRSNDKEMMRNFAYTREQHGRKILFNSHTLDTETMPNVHGQVDKYSISGVRRSAANFFAPSSLEGERIYLVQFKPEVALTQQLKDTFQSLVGVSLGPYLPHNAFAVFTTSHIVAKAMTMPEVSWAGDFPTEAKVYGPLLDFRSGEITQLPASASLELHGVSLDVRLAPASPVRTLTQLQIIMAKWQAALVEVVQGTTIKVISNVANDRLWIQRAGKSDAKELNAIVDYLIAQQDCFGVQLLLKKQATNQYAQWITQSNDALAQAPVSNGALPGRTIWQRGLQGQGQIIGVADSGLDYSHCFFRDTSGDPTITVNNGLRKVIAYQDIADDEDGVDGHGTHVCGTVLGEATAAYPAVLNLHSGLAPKAKLVFSDIETTYSDHFDGLDGRDFPSLILNYAYNAGARIHTNSWGTSDNSYDSDAASLDDFLYDHPLLTVLVAAGNGGSEEGAAAYTVGSPATAKNVITVGSANTANAGMVDSMKFKDWVALQNSAREILGRPTLQCCANSSSSNVKSYCCESYRTQEVQGNPVKFSTQTLSDFSSRGPTRDGRYKPDVVGIGQSIVSSRSNGFSSTDVCAGSYNNKTVFDAKDGTSMATPGVAASVALIRQYFLEGYYPTGAANGANALTPSGALLGAMIMNSGRSLTGNLDVFNNQATIKSLANGVYPLSIYQGYGRIELDNVLYFSDSTFSLWVNDAISVTTGTDYDVSFVCSVNGVLRVNMGYRDAAGSASAAYVTVNDADLFVGSLLNGTDTWAGNFKTMRDSRNINEAVPYNCLAGQRIYIKVRGQNIPSGSLTVALVVTGPFTVGSLTTPAAGTYIVPQFAVFNPAEDTSSSDKNGMVAGIVVGIIVVGCIIAVIWYFVVYVPQNRRRGAAAKQRYDQTHGVQTAQMGVPVQGQPVVMGTPVHTQGQYGQQPGGVG